MSYKGAYLPEFGDFATAGAVNFRTRQVVKEGVVQAAGGQFDTQRYLLMFSPTKDKIRTLFAGEGYYTNGPFLNDNRYFRANLSGKGDHEFVQPRRVEPDGHLSEGSMECVRRNSAEGRH